MRKFLIVGALATLLLAAGYWFGQPFYRKVKERRAMGQAEAFFKARDVQNAYLSLQTALILNPTNLNACRMMADLQEQARSPQTLAWRQRVAELAPTVDNRLILASCALRFQGPPYALTAKILQELGENTEGTETNVGYQIVSAQLAIQTGRTAEAEGRFEQAIRLDPTNALHRLNLAVLRLQSTNAELAATARQQLETLSADERFAPDALRTLAAWGLQKTDWPAADRFSERLVKRPQATFDDQLLRLGILSNAERGTRNAEVGSAEREAQSARRQALGAYLTEVQSSATNSIRIAALLNWMAGHDMAGAGITWSKSLPPERISAQPAPLALANCYLAAKDWGGFESFLMEGNWEGQDFLRRALLALAQREQERKQSAQINWQQAVSLASDQPEKMSALAQLCGSWRWEDELEALLKTVVRDSPQQRWAAEGLYAIYHRRGDTPAMLRLYSGLLEESGNDIVAKNNVAILSLLLNTNVATAHRLASEVYEKDPKNFAFASTHVYALHVQGKTEEALKVMAALKPEVLERPDTAAYYGAMLAATGKREKSERYLGLAAKAPLLPEEKRMVEFAKR